ncbi:hypothetical protein BDZ85DRAFT_277193 [Elsinoe ampelina]|uniref:Uncharacterized protein n=1 Tax=Elsinoe ampelina TaxID=302913 RepID=A0A6A6GNF9_9PEZI|nr:hypothetical protein BDZ85DRAFT_277193 [Elsinoe ampelina]
MAEEAKRTKLAEIEDVDRETAERKAEIMWDIEDKQAIYRQEAVREADLKRDMEEEQERLEAEMKTVP